jgi:hypothetical protein
MQIFMPTSPNVSGGTLSNTLNQKPINNPKSITISPAKNGFILQMQKTDEYGQVYAVAMSVAELPKIIEDYLTN